MKSFLAALGVLVIAAWSPAAWASLYPADDRSAVGAAIGDLRALPDDTFADFDVPPSALFRSAFDHSVMLPNQSLIIVNCGRDGGDGSQPEGQRRRLYLELIDDIGCLNGFGMADATVRSGRRPGDPDGAAFGVDIRSLLESGGKFLEVLGLGAEGAIESPTPEVMGIALSVSGDADRGVTPVVAAKLGTIALLGAGLACLGLLGWRRRKPPRAA